ncbi:MAG: insulinase family protein [Bacteroidales bacterium]|nr:insulinase family protein [Bacteroidales bacterium]
MKKSILFALLLLFVGSASFAQIGIGGEKNTKSTDLSAAVPVDKKVIIGHLDNGFTYYIRDNKKPEDRIQFRLVSNAGSILERDDQQGLAHFCEHMAFNGIKGYPHNEMIKKLQEHGIEFGRGINAYTSFDQTVYYVDMPASDPEMVKMGIEILDGWAGNILFDQKEIESERGVIHEEWRGGVGHGDRMRKKTFPIVFEGSLYADRMPIGKEEVIMNFERQSIVDFFNDWYRPDLQAIVVVGDLQNFEYAGKKGAKAMEQRVRDVFSLHAKAVSPKPRPVFTISGNKDPLVAIATDKEATSTGMMFIWKHPKAHVGTVGDYRQGLINSLVIRMINERLGEICEKAIAPMMYAGAGHNGFIARYVREADDFVLSCSPKENRIEDAAAMLLAEMKRLDEHGFLQTELDRQKDNLISWYTRSAKEADKTESNDLADEYTRHFLEGEVIPGIRQEWKYAKEFVPEITLEECNRTIASWITDENMVFYLTAPEREGYRVPDEAAVRKIIADSKKISTEPWVDTFQDKPLFTDEVPAITPKVTKENNVLDYKEYTCPNGVRFVVKKTNLKADEIVFVGETFGGTSLYSDEDYFLAANTASLIRASGIADLTSSQLSKKLKGKNVAVIPYLDDEVQGFTGTCAPQDLESALQLLNLYYTAPRSDKDVFDRNIEQLRSSIKLVVDNPQVAFSETCYRTIYPEDKRLIVVPTEKQINTLAPDRAMQIFRERFHDASNMVFIFVGNVSDDDVALIARYLNHLPADGSQKNEKYIDRTAKFAQGIVHAEAVKGIERQGKLQIYGEMNVDAKDIDDPQTGLAIQALSNALEITLLEEVREKNGDAYTPSVGLWSQIIPSAQVAWKFSIGCDPDKIKKVEKDCIAILKQYQKKGPDAKTLAKVKEQMIVNNGTQRQENYYWMGLIENSYSLGKDVDFIVNYDEMVRSITAKQVRDLAKKYINLKNYVSVSLRPESNEGTAD